MKRLLLFAVLFAATMYNASAYEFSAVAPSGQTLYYITVIGEAWVARPGNGSSYDNYVAGDLVIPDSVTYNGITYPVTSLYSLYDGTFEGCSGLTSVTIPNSVTSIGASAFYGCSSLESITIPSSVTSIGNSAFYGCSSLESITIPSSVTSIGNFAFQSCSGLTSVTIGEGVTSIGQYAFAYCNGLISVRIPSSVTSIGNNAFESIKHIEYYGSATGSPWGATVLNGTVDGDFVYSDTTKHYLSLYIGQGDTVDIPSTVDTIGDYAFYHCSNLYSVTVPNSVTTIGYVAFAGCSGLTSISMGSGVTSIKYGAFNGCRSLSSIIIPNSVTSIAATAFQNCSGLNSISLGNNITTIGGGAFAYCTSLTSIIIPNLVTVIESSTFSGCSGLTSVTIPNSVTTIGNSAFSGCSGLTSVTIPSSVSTIGYSAFGNCSSLSIMYMKSATPPTLYDASSICDGIIDVVVPHASYATYLQAGSYYSRHNLYSDSVFVTLNINDTIRGYVTGGDSVYVYPSYLDTVILMTATPYYGYHFARWDDNTTDSVRRITNITQDITATAYFDKNRYTVQITSDSLIHGSFHPSWLSWNRRVDEINEQHDYLSEFSVDVYPYPGYHFTHWQDGDTNNPRTFIVTENAQYVAYYAKNTYALTFLSDNENMGIVNTTTVSGEYLDTTMQIYATAIPHYHFARWNDNNTDNPRRFVFDDNRTYTAYFAIDVHNVNVQVDNIAHGTVDSSGSREYGQPITVSATPFSGYQFTHWSNGSTYNPYTFAVLQDSSLTAFFVADGEPWQDTVVLYDTIIVDVHDTTYIPYAVHDTTYIDVHDTTYINVHDTTYIPYAVHDTTYIDVHDTTYIDVPYPVHDTTYVDVPYPVHDTTIVHDTTYVDVPYPVHDTTYIDVPYPVHDTTVVIDTIWLMQYDTVWLHDTIVVHDTIYITMEGVDGAEAVNAKVYASQGQIVVEGAESNTVTLYDVRGRILATRRDDGAPLRFDAPASGTYMIKIGSHAARKVVVIR